MINNANYISYSQRERHAIVDQAVQDSMEALQIPQVARRLGEYTAMLTTLLSDVTVPNISHGVMHFDASCFTKTPILAVDSDETMRWPAPEVDMHDRQKHAMREAYGDDKAQLLIDGLRADDDAQPTYYYDIDSLTQQQAAACVRTIPAVMDTNLGEFIVQSSPVALIDARRSHHRSPPILLHELMHVEQAYQCLVATPYDNVSDLCLERELESYHVEAQVLHGYLESGRRELLESQAGTGLTTTNALRIDAIRRKNVTDKTDPFWPNQQTKRILRSKDVLNM